MLTVDSLRPHETFATSAPGPGVRMCALCRVSQREQIVMETAGGTVVPSVGAMLEGWLLASPHTHVLSLADLSPLDADAFWPLVAKAQDAVDEIWGNAVTFEHGSAGSSRTAGCGVDHAHLHVVPLPADLRTLIDDISDQVGVFEWSACDRRPAARPGMDYIHLSDRSGHWITHSPQLPSQVVRRAIANLLRIETWDWKADRRQDVMASTLARLLAKQA